MNKGALVRQQFIEAMLIVHGTVSACHLQETFGITRTYTSTALAEYRATNPGVVYSHVHLCHVTYRWFKPTGILKQKAEKFLKAISYIYGSEDYSKKGTVSVYRNIVGGDE